MSSYLTFYIVPKTEGAKPISLISYSRSSDIYQYFNENINPAFIGIEDEAKYTELTLEKVDIVLEDLNKSIDKTNNRILEYQKYAAGNMEIIHEILNDKEYLEELKYTLHKIEFIRDLVDESKYSCSGYSKVLCNID